MVIWLKSVRLLRAGCIALMLVTGVIMTLPVDVAVAEPLATTQLPRQVKPMSYDIEIEPNAAALSFNGKVSILVEVLQPTSSITLNAADMRFAEVTISGGALASPLSATVQVNEPSQSVTFTFPSTLKKGDYRLSVTYSGKIGTQAVGLFALDYPSDTGTKRALFTQFENSDARRMVPCWDEPNYKAVFTLEAIVPATDMPVSNTPIVSRTMLDGGRMRVRFGATPKMSSYLMFFATGDLERRTIKEGDTELGVISRRGVVSQGDFALTSAKAILHEYNDYFGIPFPLPKLDNIAAPGESQFFGAMENWGAIFTFESILLLDPAMSTQSDTEAVFEVEAHEMAHQWFGDLVTMRWWDDIWLNEGFASWMEGRTTAKLHPEWNSALAKVGGREAAMAQDAIVSTHPVVQHITTVEEASAAFDSITYLKGQAVLGMLEGYLGADAWRNGVRRYMHDHAYGNTSTDDFWQSMETATGSHIRDIAHQFTLQPGIPLVRVTAATCENGATRLMLHQEEFSKDRPAKKPLSWTVPVIAQSQSGGAEVRGLVRGGVANLTVPGCAPVVLNAGQTGYYRTLYLPSQLEAFAQHFETMPSVDQLGLLADQWALGFAKLEPVTAYLSLVGATPVSAAAPIWTRIASDMLTLDGYYQGDDARQAELRRFARARLAPVFAAVGWTAKAGEETSTAKLRNTLIRALSHLDDAGVVDEARRRFAAQSSDPAAVPAALRKTLLGVIAEHADESTWQLLHAQAIAEKSPVMRDFLFTILGSSKDTHLATRALEMALTDEPGMTTSASIIRAVSYRHPELAFDFTVTNLDAVLAKVDSTSYGRYVPGLLADSSNVAYADKLSKFAEQHIVVSARRDADAMAANIRLRADTRTTVLPAVDRWLATQGR